MLSDHASRRLRRATAALVAGLPLAAGAAVLGAAPAAATLSVGNACLYSYNDEFRPQQVTLDGHGSPLAAPAGTTVTLSGASLEATLPRSLPQAGYDLGIFRKGRNAIPSRVWIAIQAQNTTEGVRVVALTVQASTTIKVKADGSFASGTPIRVRIPIPNQTWTSNGAGPVAFAQAPAGSLPSLPVGVSDRMVPVTGSIVVAPRLGTLRFVLDCRPGSTTPPYKTATPAVPKAFATLDSAVPVPPTRVAVKPRVASSRLEAVARRTASVSVACPAGEDCRGRLSVRTALTYKVGSRRGRVTVGAPKAYTVPGGTRRSVKVTLGAAARTLLRTRSSLRVRVTLTPASGTPVTKTLTLSR